MVSSELRLFVAVELPVVLREQIAMVISELRNRGLGDLRWARPEGVHLTLKFLGDTPEDRVPGIDQAMKAAAADLRPFSLTVAGAGVFPNLRSPRVLWLGLGGDIDSLQTLHARLEEALEAQSYPREGRRFTPHLTIARVNGRVTQQQRQTLAAEFAKLEKANFAGILVNTISLMESQLTRSGAVYVRRGLVRLSESLAWACRS